MFSAPKKTTRHSVFATLSLDWSQGSRWVGYLWQKYPAMPAFLPDRMKTELFVRGLPAQKGGSATSKHAFGQIGPPVASGQWSRRHSARSARLAEAFRVVSPIGALPAKSCSTDPHARAALPDSSVAVPTRHLLPTNEWQNFARQA